MTTLIWIFTARCNLACRHCYVAPRLTGLGELSLDEKLRLLREAWDAGVDHAGFSGGEPIIHPHFMELAREAFRLGMTMSLVTNAIALKTDIAKELARLDAHVYVSLDGTRRAHELLRGIGTWEKALKGLEALKRAGVSCSTVMAVWKRNFRTVEDYLELVNGLGLDWAAMIPVMEAGRAKTAGLAVNAKEYLEAVKRGAGKAEELGIRLSLWCTPFAPVAVDSPNISYWFCRPSRTVDVDPAGNILLCDVLDFRISNVRKGFREAIREYENHPLTRLVTNPPRLPEPCRDCPVSKQCRGGCYARSYITYGSLSGPDPLCPRVAAAASPYSFREKR